MKKLFHSRRRLQLEIVVGLLLWPALVISQVYATDMYDTQRTDREKANLMGPVKTVRTRTMEQPAFWIEKYHRSGNLTEEGADDARSGEPQHRKVYTYNAAGKKIKATDYNASRKVVSTATYLYAPNGNLIGYISFELDGSVSGAIFFKYDVNGKLNQKFRFDGDHVYKSVFTYEDAGKRVREVWQANGTVTEITRLYDDSGLKLEEIGVDPQGTKMSRRVYTYDNKANPLSESHYDRERNLIDKWEMVYEFDSQGNWTTRKTMMVIKDGKRHDQTLITERHIAYYLGEGK